MDLGFFRTVRHFSFVLISPCTAAYQERVIMATPFAADSVDDPADLLGLYTWDVHASLCCRGLVCRLVLTLSCQLQE